MRVPLTPMKALLHDAAKLGDTGAAAADDDRLPHWLAVAQAAERLATLTAQQRKEYLAALGHDVLPLRPGRPTQIEGDGRTPTTTVELLAERLRLEAEDMESAGCFELALVTVSSACRIVTRGSVASRLLATAHLGRVIRQMGALDSAAECYRTVTEEATIDGDSPVAAHGFIGLGNVAYARGNRPAHKEFFEQALKLAAPASPAELSARQGLMIAANALRLWADALLHGWRAHDLAPPGSDRQLEVIANLAFTAMGAGFPQAAINGYDYVIQRTTIARMRLPSLLGRARVAASMGDADTVDRIEHEGRALSRASEPIEIARFLFSIGDAWHTLGAHTRANALVAEAAGLSRRYGFNEIAIRAEALQQLYGAFDESAPAAPTAWTDDTVEQVRTGIGRLEALATH